ncbi:hypothetical protein [Pseudomonas sp. NPDC012596]|uniref:hypothetical protein n=1 Tax=Pseudomonas sp. NPDC012596 TaxID=3364419 RepID=UPI00369D3986
MKMQYRDIRNHYDPYEAAYIYLEQLGHHIPYMFPDLIPHLLRCIDNGVSECQFKRDAKMMFNV